LHQRPPYFIGLAASALLAALTKGNGLVICAAIVVTFVIGLTYRSEYGLLSRRSLLYYLLVFLAVFFLSVPWLTSYWHLTRTSGTPLIDSPVPLPYFLEETFVRRPGVVSVASAYLTFRWFDMLRNPILNNSETNYPLHRTSLWSQLYGRFHFVHFDAWPPTWASRSPLVINLGRGVFIAALFPTLLWVLAILREAFITVRRFFGDNRKERLAQEWFLMVTVVGYLVFSVLYSLLHRDFAAMKIIYIFPGLLAFMLFFARAYELFYRWVRRRFVLRLTDFLLLFLILLYVLDVAVLIRQLWSVALPHA
jgi:hypothetical protein